MTTTTRDHILQQTTKLLATHGAGAVSMRAVAKESGVAASVIYHYFEDKDVLLKEVFDHANRQLGQLRAQLPPTETVSDMLAQRIQFQLDHAGLIVAVLKYFFAYRELYPVTDQGVLPEKSCLHIEEVLLRGQQTGEFYIRDVTSDARVITHAINGFVLEYYPATLPGKKKQQLVGLIHGFLLRAVTKGGDCSCHSQKPLL
jgi:AcrR family transcriptional regulator